ncbi:MAG TPA: single-stranded DNA-binding protein [bacterium]|nr:single-stranded DNA-binding protein [bacterium]
MEDKPKIYGKILDIQDEIPAILKNREFKQNDRTVYKFRGIDDLYNALNPLFKKHRVFMTPEILEHDSTEKLSAAGKTLFYEKMVIKYRLYTEDGSYVEASTKGIGMDSGDKAGNKAMSVAQKYALIQIFSIPTDEPKDPENNGHQVKQRETITPAHKMWKVAVDHLKKPDSKMKDITSKYDVSKANQIKLQEEAI